MNQFQSSEEAERRLQEFTKETLSECADVFGQMTVGQAESFWSYFIGSRIPNVTYAVTPGRRKVGKGVSNEIVRVLFIMEYKYAPPIHRTELVEFFRHLGIPIDGNPHIELRDHPIFPHVEIESHYLYAIMRLTYCKFGGGLLSLSEDQWRGWLVAALRDYLMRELQLSPRDFLDYPQTPAGLQAIVKKEIERGATPFPWRSEEDEEMEKPENP